MKDYRIEFTLKFNNLFKSLVVVINPEDDKEFIKVCESIFAGNTHGKRELSVYFFRSSDDARKFTYKRLVLDESEGEALVNSDCLGYLMKKSLHIFKEKTDHTKIFFPRTGQDN